MGNPKILPAPLPRLVTRRDLRHNPVTASIKRIAGCVPWSECLGERIGQSSHRTDVSPGKYERRPSPFPEIAQATVMTRRRFNLPFGDVTCNSVASLIPALLLIAVVAQSQTLTVTLSPGANVQSIVNAHPANTTFLFQPGIYRLQSIQPKNGDSFVGQNSPILSGARVLTVFTRLGNYWVAGGQTQQGQLNGVCLAQYPMCQYPEDLYFDNVPLLHVASLSAVGPGSWYFDYPNHNIYFFDNPSGHVVEASVTRSAFSGPAANVTISGLTVEKYAIPAQFGAIGDQYPGPNWTVTNNEVRWNHGTGITVLSGSQATLNYCHNNGQKGIGGSGSNVLVEANQVSFNNWAGFDPGWEAGGMKFALTTNLTVSGNSVHDNAGPGIWADVGNINTLIESNVVIDNTAGAGIQDEISYSAIIRDNTVSYNTVGNVVWLWGSQILIQNSQNVQVYENTVQVPATGGNGIGIIQQNRGFGVYGPYVAINNSVHNNTVFYGGGVSSSGLVADYNLQALLQNGNNSFDYNTYYLSDPNWYHWAWGVGVTFAQLQQAGQELHGTAIQVTNGEVGDCNERNSPQHSENSVHYRALNLIDPDWRPWNWGVGVAWTGLQSARRNRIARLIKALFAPIGGYCGGLLYAEAALCWAAAFVTNGFFD